MAIDLKKLEEARKTARERTEKMDALTLSVLKGHWAIDYAMNEVLPRHGKETEKTGFTEKARTCQKLGIVPSDDPHWDVLWAADSLRNELAHSRDEKRPPANWFHCGQHTVALSVRSKQRDLRRWQTTS